MFDWVLNTSLEMLYRSLRRLQKMFLTHFKVNWIFLIEICRSVFKTQLKNLSWSLMFDWVVNAFVTWRQKLQLKINTHLTLSWWRSLSHRNQAIDLKSKSVDWFLQDRDLRHERVKPVALSSNIRKKMYNLHFWVFLLC